MRKNKKMEKRNDICANYKFNYLNHFKSQNNKKYQINRCLPVRGVIKTIEVTT